MSYLAFGNVSDMNGGASGHAVVVGTTVATTGASHGRAYEQTRVKQRDKEKTEKKILADRDHPNRLGRHRRQSWRFRRFFQQSNTTEKEKNWCGKKTKTKRLHFDQCLHQ